MKRGFRIVALCATVVMLHAGLARGQSQLPECPSADDQLVNVTAQQAAPFTVAVKNLGNGSVSIFQYPLGGTLMVGMKTTDFVFIPDAGFTGTTTFMYRVTPEAGCKKGALLGKVTFVGPTTSRQFGTVNDPKNICGTSTPLVVAACSLMIGVGRARRRR
jgi:hypothetical protein